MDHPHVTPEQARAQLAASRARPLGSDGDRAVHAVGTAVFGLTTGFYMATQNLVTGTAGIVLSCLVVAIWVAEALWVERAARTVPRRASLWSRVGIGGSLVLALVVVLPWLNLRAQTEPNTWPMVLVGALVAAVPSLVAAAAIARGRR